MLKTLAAARTVSFGRPTVSLCALRCAGQDGVRAWPLGILKDEIERGMRLMGVTQGGAIDRRPVEKARRPDKPRLKQRSGRPDKPPQAAER